MRKSRVRMELYKKLKFARIEKNLDQTKLARMLGVTRKTIHNWENAISFPRKKYILLLCDILGMDNSDFTFGKYENDPARFELPQDATVAPAERRHLPVIGLAEAGPGIFTDPDFRDPDETASCPAGLHDPRAFWVPVVGDSMRPFLLPGSRVCVSPNMECNTGNRAVIGLKSGERIIAEVKMDEEIKLIKYSAPDMTISRENIDFLYPIVYVKEPR